MIRQHPGQAGAASVLAVGLIAALVLALTLAGTLATALGARQRAAAAADAAALAGADTALGVLTGVPCVRAAAVAAADGAPLAACRQSGPLVRVDVTLTVLGFPVAARALAGPPTARSGRRAVRRLRGPSDPPVYGVRDRRPPQHIAAVGTRQGEGGRPCPAPRSS